MPRDANDTTPEMPAVGGDDDEATRIDPKPPAAVPVRAKFAPEEDDEATKATGTPKKVREVQKVLEESRRMNAVGGPKEPAKKLHPLIPIGVAFAILAVLLLLVNWMVKPSVGADGQPEERGGVRKLFDW